MKIRNETRIELRNLVSKVDDVIFSAENIVEDHFSDYGTFSECDLAKAIDEIRMDNINLLAKLKRVIKLNTPTNLSEIGF